jgi:hypothetical protein
MPVGDVAVQVSPGICPRVLPIPVELGEVDLGPVAVLRRRPAGGAGLPDNVALAAAGDELEGLGEQPGLLGLEGAICVLAWGSRRTGVSTSHCCCIWW